MPAYLQPVEADEDGTEKLAVRVATEKRTTDKDTQVTTFTRVGSPDVVGTRAENGTTGRVDILCFIPGFDYDFRESLARGSLLARLFSSPEGDLVSFVFSWPSDGVLNISAYLRPMG